MTGRPTDANMDIFFVDTTEMMIANPRNVGDARSTKQSATMLIAWRNTPAPYVCAFPHGCLLGAFARGYAAHRLDVAASTNDGSQLQAIMPETRALVGSGK